MRTLSVREARAAVSGLEALLAAEGEVVITRRGRPIARVLPIAGSRRMPSNADLRARMPSGLTPSEVLLREERDAR